MKDYEIKYLKEKLLSEREDALEKIRTNQEYIEDSNIKEDLMELSSYDNHPADTASELFEREKMYALEKHNAGYLQSIQDSLKKIEDKSYGVCDFCGKEIEFQRLDAQPTAKLCIDCQEYETMDSYERDSDRPIEEDFLAYPFGRTFTDRTNNIVYDGEDTWQDVQRYGSSSGPQDISVNRPIDYENAYYDSDEEVGLVEKIESIDSKDYKDKMPEEEME